MLKLGKCGKCWVDKKDDKFVSARWVDTTGARSVGPYRITMGDYIAAMPLVNAWPWSFQRKFQIKRYSQQASLHDDQCGGYLTSEAAGSLQFEPSGLHLYAMRQIGNMSSKNQQKNTKVN